MANVLILGGAGFIGSHLALRFRQEGHAIVIYDVNNGWIAEPELADFAFVKDCVTEQKHLGLVLEEYAIDVAFYLSGINHTVATAQGPADAYKSGVYGLQFLLGLLRQNPIPVVISSSSLCSGVFEPTEVGRRVSTALGREVFADVVPANASLMNLQKSYHPYVSNKLAMEMAVRDAHEVFGLPFLILRYGTQYGERMAPNVVTYNFVMKALHGEPLVVYGDGSQWRQHQYIGDTVEGHVKVLAGILSGELRNETLSLAPAWVTPVSEVAEAIQQVMPGTKVEYREARALDLRLNYIDPAYTRERIGWEASTGLLEGVKRTVSWYARRVRLGLATAPEWDAWKTGEGRAY
jgi:UDP-glucuronate decarboxylase